MSNHSSDPDNEMARRLEKQLANIGERLAKEPDHRVGATGQFPNGKLTNNDQGEIGLRIAAIDGTVVMDFGKPVAWIGLQPAQARAMAESLVKFANQIEGE